MNSEFARGLPSAISNLRKASARSDSVAARGRVWTGTLSLFFPDETSSVEDRVDEGGESSDLVGETVDQEMNKYYELKKLVEFSEIRRPWDSNKNY